MLLAILSIAHHDNPFMDRIKPDVNMIIGSSSPLSRDFHSEDRQYLTYEETRKVDNPESYQFLEKPVKFFAFAQDSAGKISSVVLYIEYSDSLISLLQKEFGQFYSTSETTGTGTNGQKFNYETVSWKIGNSVMLVAPGPHRSRSKGLLTRIWIMGINPSK